MHALETSAASAERDLRAELLAMQSARAESVAEVARLQMAVEAHLAEREAETSARAEAEAELARATQAAEEAEARRKAAEGSASTAVTTAAQDRAVCRPLPTALSPLPVYPRHWPIVTIL